MIGAIVYKKRPISEVLPRSVDQCELYNGTGMTLTPTRAPTMVDLEDE